MTEELNTFRKNGKSALIGEIHAQQVGIVKERSEMPDDGDRWEESDKRCDECGKLCWEAPWWDDAPSNGGACIGTQYRCGECDWIDSN